MIFLDLNFTLNNFLEQRNWKVYQNTPVCSTNKSINKLYRKSKHFQNNKQTKVKNLLITVKKCVFQFYDWVLLGATKRIKKKRKKGFYIREKWKLLDDELIKQKLLTMHQNYSTYLFFLANFFSKP